MRFTVPADIESISVEHFLRRHCSVSARMLTKLKQTENGITANGYHVRSIDKVHAGDNIDIVLPEDKPHIIPVDLGVKVAYEDDSVIVFDKPANMPVHPVHDYRENTLANAAAYIMQQRGESYSFRAVNRLDKDTSGLVLCAKNRYAAAFLPAYTDKIYTALCEGIIEGSGTIDKPLRLKSGHTIQREVCDDGIRAVTHYRVIANYEGKYTLLEIKLETGRTHQIRAHFSGIGHPLAGDDMYGGHRDRYDRQCLHCSQLTFTHPITKEIITVKSTVSFI